MQVDKSVSARAKITCKKKPSLKTARYLMAGAELTDFVLVLNTKEAVKTFSHFGSITLGTNISGYLLNVLVMKR